MENDNAKTIIRDTKCGKIRGIEDGGIEKYLGIRFARAGRFEYATAVTGWEGIYDATEYGEVCTQKRIWYEHLEIPERKFYQVEYRQGQSFKYSEDCLKLNIFAPRAEGIYPVLVFIHGGGFDSGSCYDSAIDGTGYAERGIVFVAIQYRVGVFGYLTHEDIEKRYGHDGNFGLDDQQKALKWIKDNIADYKGDADNITVMGQSAGAISIQYLCLNPANRGLFNRAIMMSGGGMFPKLALPRPAERSREYWLDLMHTAGASTLDELKALDAKKIFDGLEELQQRRKDNSLNTMPVLDGYLISDRVDRLIQSPLDIEYILGYTNNDLYASIMAHIAHRYAKGKRVYLYYFDIDAPGTDNNGAFHSCDLRYVFGTLQASHRPYDQGDREVSRLMMDYICSFAKTGNPNNAGLPEWNMSSSKALHIVKDAKEIKMGSPNVMKLLFNMLTKGDPKFKE